MKLETYIPCARLQSYIRSYAISEVDEARVYNVLPSGGIVLGFQYKGGLLHLGDREIRLAASGVTGLLDSYRTFQNAPHTGTVLVFFRETGAAAFFRQPVHELFRESIALDHLLPRAGLLILEEQLCEARNDAARIAAVERFLLSVLHDTIPDLLITEAVRLIHASNGTLRMRDLAAQLHTSQSPLEKKFRQAVGASPKKYATIVRFRYLLRSYDPHHSLTALGYDAGFYDQAHFIKTFRRFTGETPETFFARPK